ncbi:Ku protein [Caenispirillum bisanense]|uniref:Non-homologous end joining protein Ku n=1 Tax=Caenispirillum bisanense TaxID=414052 RepID=A0A286G1R2_9PROT|nr:Ku protein [Caenispirillum bisanense]SOD89176.1 DNA end-binding protein Ku [Caenispirillum bisanense]
MAARPYWKGHIRLALVSFPVRLYAAVTGTSKISLHRYHRDTGERVRNQLTVPDHGPIDSDEVVMGADADGSFVPIEKDDIDQLKVDSKHTIDLSHFVDASDVDAIYYDKPYFVTPDGDIANEAYVTIRDALRGAKKMALGQIVLSGKEHIVAIRPCGKGLLLETLRYADELREAEEYFDDVKDVKPDKDQVKMAQQLIESRAGAFEPETFTDHYQEALRELIEERMQRHAGPVEKGKAKPKGKVINLMDALKKSIAEDEPPKPAPKRKTASGGSSGGSRRKTG